MAPKSQRPALTQTHSRSSSGGGSKLALNLQFTQKDQAPPKFTDKGKKNGLLYHEAQPRTTSPFSRTNSKQRVRSKETIQPVILNRAPLPHDIKSRGTKHKVGFTIASPNTDDEDEWVSSGAPSREDSDAETDQPSPPAGTPVAEERPQQPPSPIVHRTPSPAPSIKTPRLGARGLDTPHAEVSLSRVPTVLPNESLVQALPPRVPSAPSTYEEPPQPQQQWTVDDRPGTPTSPKATRHTKRSSMSRPPSMYSITSKGDPPLRPHPLIRGHSYGQGAKPAPLAPLTVTSDSMPANLSSSTSPPSSMVGKFSSSPSSPETPGSPSQNSLRRTSISSARSVATLPGTIGASHIGGRAGHDRARTLSTISSSSSMAALSSLAHLPMASRPATPQIISYFPPPPANLEAIHPLLPPPYLSAHLTVVAYRSPIKESYDRVIQAKQQVR